jgi:WXXGXW repeat (2 copies)
MRSLLRALTAALLLATLPLVAEAAVFVSVSFGPPALPVYVAPPMPAPGYFWTPGYWAWDGGGYYWVPGTWVLAPAPGLLWTPGYWGWAGGVYLWHPGYWGPHVGFYGGIHYGFGYDGVGFHGGAWEGGRFAANTTVINNTTIVNNTTITRVSYNGGAGGVVATPTAAEMRAQHENHVGMSEMQQQHEQAAARDTTMRATYNHGNPSVAATAKAGVFYGKGVVAASRNVPQSPHPMSHEQLGHSGGSQPGHGSYAGGGQPGGGHGQPAAVGHGGYPGSAVASHGSHPGGSAPAGHGGYSGAPQGAPQNAHPQGHGGGERPQGHGGERERGGHPG